MWNLPAFSSNLSHLAADSLETPLSSETISSSIDVTSAGILVEDPAMYTAAPALSRFQILRLCSFILCCTYTFCGWSLEKAAKKPPPFSFDNTPWYWAWESQKSSYKKSSFSFWQPKKKKIGAVGKFKLCIALSCINPRNGAQPVPGPIRMRGSSGGGGGREPRWIQAGIYTPVGKH